MSELKTTSLSHKDNNTGTPNITMYPDGTTSIGLTHTGGFKNQLINGDFRINQRGIIGPVAAYTADRWRPNTAPTQLHWKTINPGTNIPFSKYLGVTSSSTQSIVAQLIELPDPGAWGPFESGSTWTLSWYTQQNLTDIDIYVDFVDSSAGTNSQPCTVGTPQLIESGAWGSSFSRYSVEVTITGSIAATNAALRLYYVGSNSKAFDLARVQLEPGPVATVFEMRPIGTELALCQRYYYKAPDGIWRLYQAGNNTVQSNLWFPVTMRTTPTCQLFNVNASAQVTSVEATNATPNGFLALCQPNNSTLPATVQASAGTYSGDAEL